MLLPTQDGIKCDWCGKECRDVFDYYSLACTKVHVDKNNNQVGPVQVDNERMDFDICVECYQERLSLFKKTILGEE